MKRFNLAAIVLTLLCSIAFLSYAPSVSAQIGGSGISGASTQATTSSGTSASTAGVNLSSGQGQTITGPGGACRNITNNTGRQIFIPTGNSTMWNDYITKSPQGVAITSCTADCSPAVTTWGAGCSGSAPAINNATSALVTNTAAGRSGSVTVTCNNGAPVQSGATCTAAVNGVCSTTAAACNAGTVAADNGSTTCGTNRTWNCVGSGGGTTANCSKANPSCASCTSPCGTTASGSSCTAYASSAPAGACSSENRLCTNGTLGGTYTNASCTAGCAGGTATWGAGCSGTYAARTAGQTAAVTNAAGGYTGSVTITCNAGGSGVVAQSGATCTATVNGSCNNAVALGCSAGTAISDNGQTACGTTRQWVCQGSGGGSNSGTCSKANAACAVNGVCGGSANTCSTGSASGYSAGSCGGSQTWTCNGSGGGSNASCSIANAACPVNGVCSTGGACSVGTPSGDNGAGCGSHTWSCLGSNGGSNASCSENLGSCGGGGGGGGGCFISGTRILLPNGTTTLVENIKQGDVVQGQTSENFVLRVDIYTTDEPTYSINGGRHFITAEHPVQTTEGWKSIDPELLRHEYRHAADDARFNHDIEMVGTLKVGDTIYGPHDKKIKVRSIDRIEHKGNPQKLYNLILAGDHTYYADGILVHNVLGDQNKF